ncbi:hypothetical protein, partial [Streptomyces acidiscabies]
QARTHPRNDEDPDRSEDQPRFSSIAPGITQEQLFKRRYRNEQEIPAELRGNAPTGRYRYEESCGAIHVGRTRRGEREKYRTFGDLTAALQDLLTRLMGQATRKQVAEMAGLRSVPPKELEECLKHPEGSETLGEVLRVYRVGLGVAMPTR